MNRCVVSIKGRARTKNGEEIAISAAKQRNLFYHFSGVILKNDFTCLTLKNLYCARKESAARHLSSHNKAQHETNSSPHLISKSCSLQMIMRLSVLRVKSRELRQRRRKENTAKWRKNFINFYYNRLRSGMNARRRSGSAT